jgi:1-acyl-sn-glycerol-3-phosphate acyltransferase
VTEIVERPAAAPPAAPPQPTGELHPTHPGVLRAADRPKGPFAPWSPCEPVTCLPSMPRGGRLRMARRLVALAGAVLVALLVAPLLPLVGAAGRERLVRRIFATTLRAAGVRLEVSGASGLRPDDGSGALVVANHLSWIDVLALGAVTPVTMLAKREVADWPVIGPLAARVGTVFLDREGLRSLPRVVDETADALRGGALIGVFPEATTWCGAASGEFRRAPFQAALDAGVPVRPVTFALRTPDGRPTTAASFVGDQTLGDSLARVLRMPAVVCAVTVGDVIESSGDRRDLARRASTVVRAAA